MLNHLETNIVMAKNIKERLSNVNENTRGNSMERREKPKSRSFKGLPEDNKETRMKGMVDRRGTRIDGRKTKMV